MLLLGIVLAVWVFGSIPLGVAVGKLLHRRAGLAAPRPLVPRQPIGASPRERSERVAAVPALRV